MVCVHGFGASRESWNELRDLLASQMQLYLLDLKGFGLSAKPPHADYSMSAQAEVISRFITAHDLHDVTLMGHSYGGGVALLTLFADQEQRIRRLVLIDAAGYAQPLPYFIGVLRVRVLNRSILTLLPSRTRARIVLRHLFHSRAAVTQERVARYAQYSDMPGAHDAMLAVAREIIPVTHKLISARIPTITIPTLIVWGDDDRAIDVANAYRFHRDINNSRLAIMKDRGHIPKKSNRTRQPISFASSLAMPTDDVLTAVRLYLPMLAGIVAIAAMIAVRQQARRLNVSGEPAIIELDLGLIRLPIRVRRSFLLYAICVCALLWSGAIAITRNYASLFPSKLNMEVFYDRDGLEATIDALPLHDRDALHMAQRWWEIRATYYQRLDREITSALPHTPRFFAGGELAVHSTGETTFVVKKVSGWQRYHIEVAEGELLHTLELPNQTPRQLLTAFAKLDTSSDYLNPSLSDLVMRRGFVIRSRFKQYFGAMKVAHGAAFKVSIVGVTRVTLFPLPDFSNTLYLADMQGVGLVPIAYAVYLPAERGHVPEE